MLACRPRESGSNKRKRYIGVMTVLDTTGTLRSSVPLAMSNPRVGVPVSWHTRRGAISATQGQFTFRWNVEEVPFHSTNPCELSSRE